ncbi:Histone H3 (Lys4) methyltransferase complex and RNA cleavage factor II complex, subunit SWD2, partial [Phaffia rhodozyma]
MAPAPPIQAPSGKEQPMPVPITLTPQIMTAFKPAKVFPTAVEPGSTITSITFDDMGDNCVTSGDDDAFKLWNCRTGKHTKTFYSKKYGIDHVRFTHGKTNLIHASTRINGFIPGICCLNAPNESDDIRYHSLHDNKYLTYFTGHTDKVIALAINPSNDQFISSSLDGTVRLWDIRTPHCRGRTDIGSGTAPIVCYDNQGIVFAVAENCLPYSKIHMYDSSNFDAGPFATFIIVDPQLPLESIPPKIPIVTSLSFSPHGKYILVGTSGEVHYLLDSFTGQLLKRLVGHSGLGRNPMGDSGGTPQRGISGEEVKWSPDAKFVISG